MTRNSLVPIFCAVALSPCYAQITPQQEPQQQQPTKISLEEARSKARAAAAESFSQHPDLSRQADALSNGAQSAEDFHRALLAMQRKATQNP